MKLHPLLIVALAACSSTASTGSTLSKSAKRGIAYDLASAWAGGTIGAEINTLAKQEAQMTDMVATCENRSDVFCYAWYTGRLSHDPHFTSLLGAPGQLTDLGTLYLSLPRN